MMRFILYGSLLMPLLWPCTATAEPSLQELRDLHAQMVSQATNYLATKGQDSDGAYSAFSGIGVTALATTAMLEHGRSADDAVIAPSLRYLEGYVQPDGGIYRPGTFYRNYETCLVAMCFAAANRDGRYDTVISRAEAFVKGLQWDEGEEKDASDTAYGGAGYGKHKRPDLSNTSFLIETLEALGSDADDEAIQRALIFVSRCQNLETEHNTTPFAAKNPDGGFYYTPAAGGQSMAGTTAQGGLRSYGSMTYAGLKSMIYAGVDAEDPRVKAAFTWIRRNYDLQSNPGMGDAGYYYYLHTFAKALDAMGVETVDDMQGVKRNWKADLIAALATRQQDDGSWVNQNERWLESDPNLVTAYALLALAYGKP
jgi:squalene-hopene/tetraprenyl-beta-curcumene cyclase